MIGYIKRFASLGRDVKLHILSMSFIGFGYFGIYLVLFNLYLLRLGYGPRFIGLVNGVAYLGYSVFALAAGALGSRFGSKRVAISGAGMASVALILVSVSEFFSGSFRQVWIGLFFTLCWVGFAGYVANQNPLITALTKQDERGYAFSAKTVARILPGLAGSTIAGFIPGLTASVLGISGDSPVAFRYPLLLGALVVAGAAVMLIPTKEVLVGKQQDDVNQGKVPAAQIAKLAFIGMLLHASVPAYRTFFNVYLDAGLKVPTPLIGTLWGLSQLLSLSALLMPLLVMRLGKSRTVTIAGMGIFVAVLPIALIGHWIAAATSLFVRSLMAYIRIPTYDLLIQESVGARWRPVATGTFVACTGVIMFAIAYTGGYIITAFGYRAVFVIAAVITAIGAGLTAVFFPNLLQPPPEVDR